MSNANANNNNSDNIFLQDYKIASFICFISFVKQQRRKCII